MNSPNELGGMPLIPPPGLESRAITRENPTGERGAGGKAGKGRKGSPCLAPFPHGYTETLADITGPGCIRHIWITTPPGNPQADRNLILRIFWDNQEFPSVECPLADFFGMAHGRRRPYASALTAIPEGRGLSAYFPMPFRSHCRITLENDSGEAVSHLFYQVDYTVGDALDTEVCGYFHAQFRRQNPTQMREDFVLLDGVQGRGRFLGCVVGIRTLSGHWWGEGEMKFYLDGDTDFPTICGTGAEDYVCSAWGLGEHHAPYHGCPLYEEGDGSGGSRVSFYRWHLLDPIYFHQELRVTLQQIGGAMVSEVAAEIASGSLAVPHPLADGQEFTLYERQDDLCSTAFWYQTLPTRPFPSLPDRSARSADL